MSAPAAAMRLHIEHVTTLHLRPAGHAAPSSAGAAPARGARPARRADAPRARRRRTACEWVRDVFGNSIALVDLLEPADTLTHRQRRRARAAVAVPDARTARAVARAVSAALRPARSGDHRGLPRSPTYARRRRRPCRTWLRAERAAPIRSTRKAPCSRCAGASTPRCSTSAASRRACRRRRRRWRWAPDRAATWRRC